MSYQLWMEWYQSFVDGTFCNHEAHTTTVKQIQPAKKREENYDEQKEDTLAILPNPTLSGTHARDLQEKDEQRETDPEEEMLMLTRQNRHSHQQSNAPIHWLKAMFACGPIQLGDAIADDDEQEEMQAYSNTSIRGKDSVLLSEIKDKVQPSWYNVAKNPQGEPNHHQQHQKKQELKDNIESYRYRIRLSPKANFYEMHRNARPHNLDSNDSPSQKLRRTQSDTSSERIFIRPSPE